MNVEPPWWHLGGGTGSTEGPPSPGSLQGAGGAPGKCPMGTCRAFLNISAVDISAFTANKQTNKQCQLSESPKCFLSLLWVCSSPFPWCVGTCEAWFCTDTTLGLEYCGTHKSGYFYILWFWRSNSPALTNAEFGDLTEIRFKMHLVMLVCISLNVLSYHKPPYCRTEHIWWHCEDAWRQKQDPSPSGED